MIPVTQVRTALCLGSDADRDLQRLIDEATATLGVGLHQYLGPVTTFVDEVRLTGSCALTWVTLPRLPIAITTVEWRPTLFSTWTALAPTLSDGRASWSLSDYRLYLAAAPSDLLRVTYTSGYAVGTGPAELQALVMEMVLARYRGTAALVESGAVQSETLGDYSYTRFGADELRALSGYETAVRRWRRMWI